MGYTHLFHSKQAVALVEVPAVVCVVHRDLNSVAHLEFVACVLTTDDLKAWHLFHLAPG